jgi:hypothetical protein
MVTSIRPHGVTFQKTVIFIVITVRMNVWGVGLLGPCTATHSDLVFLSQWESQTWHLRLDILNGLFFRNFLPKCTNFSALPSAIHTPPISPRPFHHTNNRRLCSYLYPLASSVCITSIFVQCELIFNLRGRVTHICVIIFSRLPIRYFRGQEEAWGSSLTGHAGFLS